VIPKDSDSRNGHDHAGARLLILSGPDGRDELSAEFWPAAHRKRIEAALKNLLPTLQILEKLED
jgi:hypothetical protein